MKGLRLVSVCVSEMNPDEQELAGKRKSPNTGLGSCLRRTFTSWDFPIRDKETGTPAWKTVYAVGVPHKRFQSRHFLKVTVETPNKGFWE